MHPHRCLQGRYRYPTAIQSEDSSLPPSQSKSILRPEAQPFVPAHVQQAAEEKEAAENADESDDEDEEAVGLSQLAEEDTGIDGNAAAQTVDAGRPEQAVKPPTVEEIAAARRISTC